jgi:hypothetical protein
MVWLVSFFFLYLFQIFTECVIKSIAFYCHTLYTSTQNYKNTILKIKFYMLEFKVFESLLFVRFIIKQFFK